VLEARVDDVYRFLDFTYTEIGERLYRVQHIPYTDIVERIHLCWFGGEDRRQLRYFLAMFGRESVELVSAT